MSEAPKSGPKYSLIGAINPRGRGPAICVPAFSTRDTNSTYIQYVGIDDLVAEFEELEESEWEPVHGSIDTWILSCNDTAIHWVVWTDDFADSLVGPIEKIRSDLLKGRWIVDGLDNPFERLDFAQLSGLKSWFIEEAARCEISFTVHEELRQWLEETLLLSRVRFAIDTLLVKKSAPRSVRRRLGLAIQVVHLGDINTAIENIIVAQSKGYVESSDAEKIRRFISEDVVCSYVQGRLNSMQPKAAGLAPSHVAARRWYKELTLSDAQRKRTGNQRGGITLTKANLPIKPQSFFRRELFGDAEWLPGENQNGLPLETAVINFRTRVMGKDLGSLNFTITDAANREANQGNHTSTLHVGPLTRLFRERDFTGVKLTLERTPDGLFWLTID